MTVILSLNEIKARLDQVDPLELVACMEQAFIVYSHHKAVMPEVGYMEFDQPPGDVHIKYGYFLDDDMYIVKIASSFYENPKHDLSSTGGVMLLFNKNTGQLQTILLDEGYLTDLRTALAGAVAAKHFAPKNITAIGIVGTGIQARLQLLYLRSVLDCQKVYVYGRSKEKLEQYADDMRREGFTMIATQDMQELVDNCNYIVTTTPSRSPLLSDVKPGTHVTAVGADAPGKQELRPDILQLATRIVADSRSQCQQYGEIHHALGSRLITADKIHELGECIALNIGRQSEDEITVADLTGLAVQDLAIATFVTRLGANDIQD